MDVKFISQDNEVQKLYAKFGMVVPVGDLSTGKAPAIQPLPSTSTQTSVTAQFNVMSGADISALSYTVNDGEAVSITPAKGVVTITLTDLEHNSGPYEIEITAVNENGSTSASVDTDLVHYTNWATPDEVLLGNKYIGEDGQEHTGEYECPTCPEPVLETVPVTPTTSAQTITPSTGYDGIGTVNVSAVTSAIDANITAGNIKNGVTILGVTGTMTGGPGTGGATVQSCTMDYVSDPSMGEFPRYSIVLDTMPADIDPENHHYYAGVFALCYNADPFSDGDFEHLAIVSGQSRAEFDLENNTIYDYFGSAPVNQYYQEISSTSGCVVLYDGSIANPIYKWPCTITTPTNSQQ